MSYFRRDEDDDNEIALEDQLRAIACDNPTLIGDELITLHGTVRATTKEELYDVRANRQRRARQRAAVPS